MKITTINMNNKHMDKFHKEFLDDLRESGVTNMYGASPYIEEQFEVSRSEARNILQEWMETFDQN